MFKVIYAVLLAATVGAYFSVKDFLAWPVQRDIVVSNVTVSYVLGLALVGGISPWLTKKIWPKAPKWAFVFVAGCLGVIVVLTLKLLGEPTRF